MRPIAAAVQPLAVPRRLGALLVDIESDASLIAGFHLGYGGRTRAAYLADLRNFHAWCARIGIGLLAVHRSHVEAYIRALEQAGRSRATVARRLATLAGFTATRFRRERSPTPPPPTFVAPRWRVTGRRLALTARKRSRRAGLSKRITPHSLRHTMVTLALDAGVSLRDVQDAVRHADPRTTRR